MVAFQEGPEVRERKTAVVTAPKPQDNMAIRDGCLFNPQRERHTHTNPAYSQIVPLGPPSGPCECWGRTLQSLPDPWNHVMFITTVPEMEGDLNPCPLRDRHLQAQGSQVVGTLGTLRLDPSFFFFFN